MFEKIKTIMSSEELKALVPVSAEIAKIKAERDKAVMDIIAGRDKRLLIIVGPCSADNETAVCDYVSRLAKLADEIKDKIFIVPRIYTNKPRTKGEGYKGIMHNPDPHKKETDIQAGKIALRKKHFRAISQRGLSSADEMLFSQKHV